MSAGDFRVFQRFLRLFAVLRVGIVIDDGLVILACGGEVTEVTGALGQSPINIGIIGVENHGRLEARHGGLPVLAFQIVVAYVRIALGRFHVGRLLLIPAAIRLRVGVFGRREQAVHALQARAGLGSRVGCSVGCWVIGA